MGTIQKKFTISSKAYSESGAALEISEKEILATDADIVFRQLINAYLLISFIREMD
jgi:hypothetical protein